MTSPVAELLEDLHLAPRQAHKALTLWPLRRRTRGPQAAASRCVLLGEALASGTALLAERSEEGGAPIAHLENRGALPVLVLLGEEIPAARRDRVAGASLLLAPGTSLVLDGTCIEWARANGEVLESFHTVDEQVGFVAAIADEVVGLELLASPALFAASFARLAASYATNAVDGVALRLARERTETLRRRRVARAAWPDDEPGQDPEPSRPRWYDAPEPFLAALSRAPFQRWPAKGLGWDLRLAGRGASGCALDWNGIVRLSAFAEPLA